MDDLRLKIFSVILGALVIFVLQSIGFNKLLANIFGGMSSTITEEMLKTKSTDEIDLWNITDQCGTIKCYRIYLDKYPEGKYIEIAKEKIRINTPKPYLVGEVEIKSFEDINKIEQIDYWKQTKMCAQERCYVSYINKYPEGLFVDIAKNEIGRNKFLVKNEILLKPKWCKRKQKQSEKIICSSRKLWIIDDENISVYKKIYNTNKKEQNNKEELLAWLSYRDKGCISVNKCVEIYNNRIHVLNERLQILNNKYNLKFNNNDKPKWCDNKLDRTENYICQNRDIWGIENTLVYLYEKTTKNQRKILNMAKWRNSKRKEKCRISVSECLQSYHEKVYQIYYLLKL